MSEEEVVDPIITAVIKKFRERSALGMKKYGANLAREDLDEIYWLHHAQAELLDGAAYLERLIQDKLKETSHE